jgi:hypothetical protein
LVENAPNPVPEMPQLEGRALELYEKHFGQARYQEYNECRKDKPLCKRSELPQACLHQPRHDVESYFWIIFMFLLQAIPEEDVVRIDDTLEEYREQIRIIQGAAAARTGGGVRTAFITDQVRYYRDVLHPGLTKFAPLIVELAHQIRPEWQFLKPQPPADHLHEAFRRILLKWIVDLNTSGTPFPVQCARKRLLQDPRPNHS